jgi:hypothetical protein
MPLDENPLVPAPKLNRERGVPKVLTLPVRTVIM